MVRDFLTKAMLPLLDERYIQDRILKYDECWDQITLKLNTPYDFTTQNQKEWLDYLDLFYCIQLAQRNTHPINEYSCLYYSYVKPLRARLIECACTHIPYTLLHSFLNEIPKESTPMLYGLLSALRQLKPKSEIESLGLATLAFFVQYPTLDTTLDEDALTYLTTQYTGRHRVCKTSAAYTPYTAMLNGMSALLTTLTLDIAKKDTYFCEIMFQRLRMIGLGGWLMYQPYRTRNSHLFELQII